MAKSRPSTRFFCNECGYESAKWMGQCPACKAWNTMVEEPVSRTTRAPGSGIKRTNISEPVSVSAISLGSSERFQTGMSELDRVLGGGVVPGSLVLVGGDPGIGKSTLLLQLMRQLSSSGHTVLYISGEESLAQIKMRAMRIGEFDDRLLLLTETDLTVIDEVIRKYKPEAVVIDSIQTMFSDNVASAPGSVSQVREATNLLMNIAKTMCIAIFIVGHVTKEGTVAGPRVLEHMVDTVLYFEGDRHASYRIVRAVKNRFGSTNEIGVFEMRNEGLRQVANPSEYMLSGRPHDSAGSCVVCAMEGTRPMLVEVQALVCHSSFGIPRRQATGIDINRVNLLMAVLEKRMGYHLGECDAYLNVAGGMRMNEPAMDLGIAVSAVSSFKNAVIASDTVVFGEVGLSGEVRSVTLAQNRVAEAAKLGFTQIVMPASNAASLEKNVAKAAKIIPVESLYDAIKVIL
ncbi:MAG: DNA repair protein RadA [Lachnospiraceae bacterium]|nr:DNA repair protein RadA [Lachnospiraceae bacterium]